MNPVRYPLIEMVIKTSMDRPLGHPKSITGRIAIYLILHLI